MIVILQNSCSSASIFQSCETSCTWLVISTFNLLNQTLQGRVFFYTFKALSLQDQLTCLGKHARLFDSLVCNTVGVVLFTLDLWKKFIVEFWRIRLHNTFFLKVLAHCIWQMRFLSACYCFSWTFNKRRDFG